MKQTIKLGMCAAIAALSLSNQITLAQWNVGGGIGDRWARTNNTGFNNTIRRGGMGSFQSANPPAAAFHINANLLTPVAPLALNTFLPGEVFRTTATDANINAWRLFTGAGNGTEKFALTVPGSSNNVVLQATQPAGDMRFNTGGAVTRMFIQNNAGPTAGFVGIGTNFITPTNLLHLHQPAAATDVFTQITNEFTTSAGGAGFHIGVTANGDAQIRQRTLNHPMLFFTNGNSTGLLERMRIDNGFGGPDHLTGNITKVSISHGGGNPPITNPIAMLNMGLSPGIPLLTGARNWMDVGTFMTFGSDNMYVGLKNEGGTPFDKQDAIINWGNNDASDPNLGPDNLRFIFTEGLDASPNTAALPDGIEAMRMTPAFNIAGTQQHIFTGIGGNSTNLYSTGTANPGTTLEINSPEATTNDGGSSGLRFTDLTTASPTTTVNPGPGVLAVDTNGDVIYVPDQGAIGASVCTAGIPTNFVSKWTGTNLCQSQIFDDGTSVRINTTIGTAKLNVENTRPAGGLGIFARAASASAINNAGIIAQAENASITNTGGEFVAGSNSTTATNIAVRGTAQGTGDQNTGINGVARDGTFNIGGQFFASGGTVSFGIFAKASPPSVLARAAFLDGDVEISGSINPPSDIMLKENIQDIPNASQTLMRLRPRTFTFKTNAFPMNLPTGIRYGMIAQEMDAVLPELIVNTLYPAQKDSAGNIISPEVEYKSANYDALIPILVQGFKEQQGEIVSLKHQLDSMITQSGAKIQSGTQSLPSQSITLASGKAILYQNNPNPFNGSTSISYYLADETANAEMIFFDMYGNEIKRVRLENKGNAKLDVNTQDLASGIYSYSLIADGKVVKTMQMMRSK